MIALAFLLLALLGTSMAASATAIVSVDGLSFQSDVNVTASQSDDRFHFRETSLSAFAGFTLYTSVDIDATGNSNGGTAHVDAIVGLCYASALAIPLVSQAPGAWLAYFTADANVNVANINLQSSLTGTAALAGKVFTKIEEFAPGSTTPVQTHLLKGRSWSQSSVTTAGTNGELKYVTYSSDDDSFDVDITFAVSSVLGKLNVGSATITPRNMESFVEIRDYPYGNPANHLRLTLYLGHLAAKASTTFTATQTVVAGTGKEQIYFKLSGEAVADGEVVNVSIDGLAKSDLSPSDIDNTLFSGQLAASGDLSAEVRVVTVDFPAGASKLSYDPAVGFGAPNAAGLLLPSLGALLLSVAVFFFVF